MKITSNHNRPQPLFSLARALPCTALLLAVALVPSVRAQTVGTWNVNSGGLWSASGNWSGGVPGLAGDVANLTYPITAGVTVTNDVSRTNGVLNIGNSSSAYTLANGSGITFTFNNNGSGARLTQTNTTAGTTLSTPLVLADSLSISNATTLTLSGLISGGASYGLTKTGAGTLVLADGNNSTYSGVTTVNAGTLQLGQSGAYGRVGSGSASIVLASGTTLSFYQGETIPQVISGAGNVTTLSSIGNGYAETMNGTNTYTGSTTVNGVGINAPILANGGVSSSIGASANTAANVVITGSGTLAYTGSKPVSTDRLLQIGTTSAAGTGTIANNSTAATNSLSFTNTGAITYGTTGQTRSLTLGGSSLSTNLFAPQITDNGAGATSFTKSGSDIWTLSGTNTYSGPTVVSGGALILTGSAASANSSAYVVAPSALLDVSGLSSTFNLGAAQSLIAGSPATGTAITNINGNYITSGTNNIAGTGTNGTLTINGSLTLNGGTLIYDLAGNNDLITLAGTTNTLALNGTTLIQGGGTASGTITLITNIASVTTGGAGNLAYAGTLPRGATASFTVAAPTVTLNVNGWSGPVTLFWQGTNGPSWDTVTTNWNNSGTGMGDLFYPLDNVVFDDTGRSQVQLVGQLNPTSVTVQSSYTNYNFGGAGSIAGAATLTMSGSSILSITNNNSFTGGTTINSGIVRSGNVSSLGSGPLTFNAGVLDLNSNNLSIGTLAGVVGTLITDSNNFTASTNITATSHTSTLTVNQVVSNTFAGLINNSVYTNGNGLIWSTNGVYHTNLVANTVVLALTKNGPGYLKLTGANNFTGAVNVNAGTLEVTNKSGDVTYAIASGATLKMDYSTGGGYANSAMTIVGNGTNATTGFYLEGGKTYNVSGGTVVNNAPTTIRQFGTGFASIGIFDINSNPGLSISAAASGSVLDSNIQLINDGYGMVVTTAIGANTTNGDLIVNGPLDATGSGVYKRGTGSMLLNGVANTANGGLQLQAGTVICGTNNCVGTNASAVFTAGATLILNGFSQSVPSVTGTGTIVGGSAKASALTINNASGVTNTVAIGGTGVNQNNVTLTKTGAGHLVLAGVLTYTNNTTISAGSVLVGSLTNADGATLSVVDAAGTLSATNLALGTSAGSIVKITGFTGVAAPILVTNLTTAGTTYISLSGTLSAGVDYPVIKYGTLGGAGFGSFQLLRGMSGYVSNNVANSSIDVVLTSTTIYPLVWQGNLSTTWDVNTSSNWVYNVTPNVFLSGDTVQLDDTAVTASTNLTLNVTAGPSALTVTNSALNYTISGTGSLAGSGGLTKYGTASLTLQTVNTYTGPTVLNGGTVVVGTVAAGGSPSAIGAAGNNATNLVLNGAALVYTGPTNSTDHAVTIGAGGGSVSVSTNLTLSGAIGGSGAFAYNGPGQLTLSTDSTLTNGFAVNGGTLRLTTGNFAGTFVPTLLSVNTNGTLLGNGTHATGGGTSIFINRGTWLMNAEDYKQGLTMWDGLIGPGPNLTSAGADLRVGYAGGAGSYTWYVTNSLTGSVINAKINTVTTGNNLTLNVARGAATNDLTVNGVIYSSGNVAFTGNGVTLLTGTNTYSGNTTINTGTVILTNSALSGSTPVILLTNGATLNVAGLTSPVLGGSQTLQGSGTVVGSLTDSGGSTIGNSNYVATLSFNGNLTLAGSDTLDFDLSKTPTSTGGTNNGIIVVTGNLTINPSTTVNINPAQLALSGGTYKLISYTGTLTDNTGGIGTSWYVAGYTPSGRVLGVALSTATPGEIDLIVTGTPANLVWQGDNSINAWDIQTTSNWLNGASADVFYALDNVTFNDAGSVTPNVDIQAAVTPSLVVVSNTAKNYTFSSSVGQGINGAGSLTKNGTGTLTILNNNPYTGSTTINAGTVVLGDGASYDGTLSGSPITDNATLKFNVASSPSAVTTISGSGTVVQTGNQYGTLSLSASNSWTGGLNILAGTLKPTVNFALPIGESVNVASNAQFDFNGVNNNSNPNRAYSFTIAGAGPDGYSGVLVNSGGSIVSYASVSNVTMTANSTLGGSGRWDIGPATNSTFNGGGYVLTKQGSGQMSFRPQVMTNVASVQIASGNFWYEAYNETNAWTATTTNYVQSGATLGAYGSVVINTPIVSLGGTIDNQGSGVPLFTGGADLEPGTTVTSAGGSLVLGGTVYQTNAGTITLAGGNTIAFAGTDTISVMTNMTWTTGTLQLGYSTPSGSIPDASLYVPSGGTFSVDRSDVGYTLTNVIYGDGSMQVVGTNALTINGSASVTLGGNFNVGQGQYGALLIAPGASITCNYFLMGNPNGAGGAAVTQTGGSVTATNNTSAFGYFRIGHWATETSTYAMYGGTMNVPADLSVGYDGVGVLRQTNGVINVGTELEVPQSGRSGYGIYSLEGGTINIGYGGIYCAGGSSAIYLGGGTVAATTNWTTTSAMTLSGTNGNLTFDTGLYSNVLSGVLSGPGGLTKVSTGTLNLAAANTYTGSTMVNNGTLLVSGTVAGALTVGSSGELTGMGTVKGALINSGLLAPGTNGFGALTVSNTLTLNSGGTVALSINRAAGTNTFGSIKGISSVSYGGTLTVTGTGTFTNGDTFKVFSAGSASGTFTATNLPSLTTGLKWNWNPTVGTLSVVPAVSTAPFTMTTSLSPDGTTLTLSWPSDHIGWRLLVQTNNLSSGISANPADWGTVSGSSGIDTTNITINPALPTEFYQMVYP